MISVFTNIAVRVLEKVLEEAEPALEAFLVEEVRKSAQSLKDLLEKSQGVNNGSQIHSKSD